MSFAPEAINKRCVVRTMLAFRNLREGVVSRLYAQQTYQWGYRSIEILADKVIQKKDPATPLEDSPLPLMDKNNADQMEQNWKKWLRQ